MTVFLTSPVLGQAAGTAYTGALESWLLHEGYARADADSLTDAIAVTPTAAKLVAGSNAVNIVTGGDLVLATKDGVLTTIALAAADTPAAAATKIDTAMAGLADAAINASKLEVTSIATGTTAYVKVISGTGTVLANLGLAVDAYAYGGDGRPTGASNVGVQADTVANQPGLAANREAPYFPGTPDLHSTIANDGTHLTETSLAAPGFDMDVNAVDAEAPGNLTVVPKHYALAGGEMTIYGRNLEGVTGITVGGTAVVSFDDDAAADGVIVAVAPAKIAGSYDVVVTDGVGSATKVAAAVYAAEIVY